MILIMNNNNRIYAYNTKKPKEAVSEYENAVWFEGKFNFSIAETQEGKRLEYYYKNGKIRAEYVDIPTPSARALTQTDRIEAAVDYLMATKE